MQVSKDRPKLYQKILPIAKRGLSPKQSISSMINELESSEQINLGLNVKKDNQIKKMRKKTRGWFEIMRINPYWKNFSAVTMVTSSLCITAIFAYIFLTRYERIPNQIPALYDQSKHLWTSIDKQDLLILPFIHLIVTFILVRLNISIFKFDRRVVLILNNSMLLFNFLFLYIIYQIYTMLMIY
jgi:hypothetical protein